MKRIRLEYGNELTITDEAYENIVQLVEANQLCSKCERSYTMENPCVALNTCLSCFLRFHENKHLQFLGVYEVTKYGTYYKYLGYKGYVHLSDTHNDVSHVHQDNYATLKEWGFSVPDTIMFENEARVLHRCYWSIYGEFATNSVVIAKYQESYGERLEMAFIAVKHGDTQVFNKRKGADRKLWLEAKAKCEAVKDPQGKYHLGEDYSTYQLTDSHLYIVVSQIASAKDTAKA